MEHNLNKKSSALALIPFLIFVVIYLGAGLILQAQGVEMAFYQFPSVTAMFIALLVAFAITKGTLDERFAIFARGAANIDVLTMLMIYLLAGAFSSVATSMGGRDATVNLGLSLVPVQFLAAGVFIISAFMGTATGTSMGTIGAIVPIAVGVADKGGLSIPLLVGACVGGAMFGDNLSMISDTTIAAVRTQGCEMKDKFRMNFFIVLPAALIAFILFVVLAWGGAGQVELQSYSIWKVLPYLVVLVGALAGVNVFLILTAGTVLSLIVGVASGAFAWTQIFAVMGSGVTAMYDITVISIIVACIGALVREYGGIQWLIDFVRRRTRTKRGAQLGIAGLVAAVDVATANNTVAIVMTGSVAKDISEEYGVDPRRTASLLDIFASVMQGIIPFGAQLLYASAGAGVSAVKIMPYMFYCYLMAISALIFILFWPQKESGKK